MDLTKIKTMAEKVSGMRHYIRIGMLLVWNHFGTALLFDLQVKIAKKEHQHWITEHDLWTSAKKLVVEQQSNRLKRQKEKMNSEIPWFYYKYVVLFYVKLKLFLWLCVEKSILARYIVSLMTRPVYWVT